MRDFSFLRLKNDFENAKDVKNSPVATHIYSNFIQLSPNESYCQITNITEGISFEANYEAHLVDPCNNVIKDITNNVFIREFTDSNGKNQCIIEIVNIGEDFYFQDLSLRLTHTISNLVYWSNIFNVTDQQLEQTSFFQYKCYDDFEGIGYTNSQVYQAIRLKTWFDIPIDESETEDYYQISKSRTISARTLIKRFEKYQITEIDNFTFLRLNSLLKSDLIYIDTIKVTNKTTLESDERVGDSNFFASNFTVSKNYDDVLEYSFQVFEGLKVVSYIPSGTYILAGLPSDAQIVFNYPITLNTGEVNLFDNNGNQQAFKNEADMSVSSNTLTISNIVFEGIDENNDFYFNYSGGLVSFIGVENEALTNSEDWRVIVQNADYNVSDYEVNDYLVS